MFCFGTGSHRASHNDLGTVGPLPLPPEAGITGVHQHSQQGQPVTQHAMLSFTPPRLRVPGTGGVNASWLCPILLLVIDEGEVPETASVWEVFPLFQASVVNVLHKSQSFSVSIDQRQRIVFWIHYEQL